MVRHVSGIIDTLSNQGIEHGVFRRRTVVRGSGVGDSELKQAGFGFRVSGSGFGEGEGRSRRDGRSERNIPILELSSENTKTRRSRINSSGLD